MPIRSKEHAAEMPGRTAREDDLPYGFRSSAAASGPEGLLLDLSRKIVWTTDIKAKHWKTVKHVGYSALWANRCDVHSYFSAWVRANPSIDTGGGMKGLSAALRRRTGDYW